MKSPSEDVVLDEYSGLRHEIAINRRIVSTCAHANFIARADIHFTSVQTATFYKIQVFFSLELLRQLRKDIR